MRSGNRGHRGTACRAALVLLLCGTAWPARAECHRSPFATTGLDFRRSLQTELRGIGITGFGRTQPYRDATISLFLGSDVSLILREQDGLVNEIGVQVPLDAPPLELARFNALVAHVAARVSGEDETRLRARLLESLGQHGESDTWAESSAAVLVTYRRDSEVLIVRLWNQTCR